MSKVVQHGPKIGGVSVDQVGARFVLLKKVSLNRASLWPLERIPPPIILTLQGSGGWMGPSSTLIKSQLLTPSLDKVIKGTCTSNKLLQIRDEKGKQRWL